MIPYDDHERRQEWSENVMLGIGAVVFVGACWWGLGLIGAMGSVVVIEMVRKN